MPANVESLLAGRNPQPLTEKEVTRAYNTFKGLDPQVSVRYVPGERSRFCVTAAENGDDVPEIIFGSDIYPGPGVVDPNSSLSIQAAAAHETTHYHRWQSKTELVEGDLLEIDEALTSLEAILRFPKQLNEHESRQLVADAIQRLQIYAHRKTTP